MATQCPNRRVMTIIEIESEGEQEELNEPGDPSAVLDEYYRDADA